MDAARRLRERRCWLSVCLGPPLPDALSHAHPPRPPEQDNKCSWLVVQALARAAPEQAKVLKV